MRGRITVLAVLVGLAPAACSGADDSSSTPVAAQSAAATEAAVGVCGVLVDLDHAVADHVNGASRQITGQTDPDDARGLLLDATAEIQTVVDELPHRYDALGLSDGGDIGQLVADASANADAVTEQLDLIRSTLTDGLVGEGPRAILTATFIHYEKVQSLAQPRVDDYADEALVQALNTEPACEHTISR